MKYESQNAPLFNDSDSQRIRDEIERIRSSGAPVCRPTRYQIKIGKINYYPGTGRIYIDGGGTHPKRGIEQLMEMIAEITSAK